MDEHGNRQFKDPRDPYAGSILLRSARYAPALSSAPEGKIPLPSDAPNLEHEYAEFEIFDKISSSISKVTT